jgi:diguanylate cyclase (GGDEF)-like protein
MLREFDSLEELKRGIYLWILPFVIVALLFNSFLNNNGLFDFVVNTVLIVWFLLSWIMVYHNLFIHFAEQSNLLLISLYQVSIFFEVVHNDLAKTGTGSLGDFIVWMPLYLMFIFLTLGIKRGLFFSIFIFLVTFGIGLAYLQEFSKESIDSLLQFYFANIIYILIPYYAQHLFRSYTEIEVFKKYAYIDSLTRIANRHRIDEWLEQMHSIAVRDYTSFSVIFFDIDHFKKVNDLYGHKIGDCVLKELAALISANLEEDDLLGRWGGEEFILLSNATGEQAWQKAEYYRELVEMHSFKGAGSLTASFGVTTYQKEDCIDSLLNRADEALYFSKNNGRNKVSFM